MKYSLRSPVLKSSRSRRKFKFKTVVIISLSMLLLRLNRIVRRTPFVFSVCIYIRNFLKKTYFILSICNRRLHTHTYIRLLGTSSKSTVASRIFLRRKHWRGAGKRVTSTRSVSRWRMGERPFFLWHRNTRRRCLLASLLTSFEIKNSPVGRRIKGFGRFRFRDVRRPRYPIPLSSLCRSRRMLQYDPARVRSSDSPNRCVLIKSKTVSRRIETVRLNFAKLQFCLRDRTTRVRRNPK